MQRAQQHEVNADAVPRAVVIGSSCIDVVRALALAGIPSGIVAPRDDGARYSRHATSLFDWEWDEPVEHHGEKLLERFVEYGRRQVHKPILFFCSEEALVFTSRFRAQLAQYFRFSVAAPEVIESLSDKERFIALCAQLSLPVPPTRVVESAAGFLDLDVAALGYPLIVKPTLRGNAWSSAESAKAVRADTVDELRSLAGQFGGTDMRFVVQQCIEGPETAIESYHVYVDAGGDTAGEFTGRKIRTLPAEYGHSTALTLTDIPDVRQLGRALVKALGLRGVAKFDFKRSRTGVLHLLEVNARFNLWHHMGARVGINLPALVYADLVDRPRPTMSPAAGATVNWVHPRDAVAARRAGVPLRQWLVWAARCQAKAYWRWDDPLPLFTTTAARLRDRVVRGADRRVEGVEGAAQAASATKGR